MPITSHHIDSTRPKRKSIQIWLLLNVLSRKSFKLHTHTTQAHWKKKKKRNEKKSKTNKAGKQEVSRTEEKPKGDDSYSCLFELAAAGCFIQIAPLLFD